MDKTLYPRIVDFSLGSERMHAERQRLLADTHGRVLEVGAGTGLNIPHYGPKTEMLTLVDRNPAMFVRAQARGAQAHFPVRIVETPAEILPFPSATFDYVAMTWTLCSVESPERVLSEVARVLKPTGEFRFFEHGLHPRRRVVRWLQRFFSPLYTSQCGNCHLTLDVPRLLHAQFRQVVMRELVFYFSADGYVFTGRASK